MPPVADTSAKASRVLGVKRAGNAPTHVDDLNRRQAAAVHPAGQLQPLELVPALRPRGGGPADEHRARLGRPSPSHLAGVVARV